MRPLAPLIVSRLLRLGAILVGLLLVAPLASAQECDRGVEPKAYAVLVDEAPTIDGVLDDPVWDRAESITEFTQVEPVFCAPGSYPTEIRILTDGDMLYFAMRAYDDDPDGIVANRMARNEIFLYEDGFNIILDTFHDHRNGYFFQVNPNGGRRDATFARELFEENWDGIWYADARIDEKGWTAEVAIPFKTLGFHPGADVWGLNLSRRVRRFNQEVRWADPSLQRNGVNVSRAGTLHGMAVAQQGIGLDVVPTFSFGAIHDEQGEDSDPAADDFDFDDHSELRIEPSFDAFYRILPSMTASVTANTDFAQTEIDETQVNLTRFPLFFPEKREFFLRDTGIFTFADLQNENGIPFFSRRIGLDDQANGVRILGGGRLAGRVGGVNVGFLDIQQDQNEGRDGENLAVARVSANVLDESTLGVLLTHGDPNSREEDLLVAADFNFRSSQLIENRFVSGALWMQQNFSGEQYGDRSTAWGGSLSYPNDRINWKLRFKDIQAGFDPALGFVNRSDIRVYEADYRYRFRFQMGPIRTIDMLLDSSFTTDRTEHLESASVWVTPLKITSQVDDSLELLWVLLYEDTVFPFYVANHVGIPPGEYVQQSGILRLKTSQHRSVRFELDMGVGQFFDGYGVRVAPLIQWRPSKYLLFSLRYDQRRFNGLDSCKSFPGVVCTRAASEPNRENRDFTIRLTRFRVQVAFSPDLSWSTLAQYDNQSDDLEIQSRLNWIIEPGRELFVVIGQDFDAKPGDFRVRRTEPAVKLRWTFRF